MGEDAMIVAIVFGSILGMITIPLLISLAKKWIDRNNSSYDEQKFERLAKAFIAYKKDSERRFQNLEAIVTDDEPNSSSEKKSNKKLEETQLYNTIEVDTDKSTTKDQHKESGDGNLRNMLKE